MNMESGQYNEPLAFMDKVIRLDANNASALYNKEIFLFKMYRYQDSLNSFAQATDIDPEFPEPWCNKRMALMCSGKYLEAFVRLTKC